MLTDLLNLLRELAAISSLTQHLFVLAGDPLYFRSGMYLTMEILSLKKRNS